MNQGVPEPISRPKRQQPVAELDRVQQQNEHLAKQVYLLRRSVLIISDLLVIGVLAIGLLLPAWTQEGRVTSVLTGGWGAFSRDEDEFGGVFLYAALIGLIAVVLTIFALTSQAVGRASALFDFYRLGVLAIASGAIIVCLLFSLVAALADEQDELSGGWGPVLLLIGVVLAWRLLRNRRDRDLWIERARPPVSLGYDRS